MKKNARIVVGFALMGLGWASLVYGMVMDIQANMIREQCGENCWEFSTSGISISFYTLSGIVLIAIGAVVFVSGKRAMKKMA